MVPRLFLHSFAMAVGLATPGLCLTPIQADRATHPNAPQRQISVADHPTEAPLSVSPAAAPVETDLPVHTLDLAASDLRRMLAAGTVNLDLPDGSHSEFVVIEASWRDATQHYRIRDRRSEGAFASTVTVRGDRFFAHLVTATTSYRLDGDASGTRLYDQRSIEARTVGFDKDYRHVPF